MAIDDNDCTVRSGDDAGAKQQHQPGGDGEEADLARCDLTRVVAQWASFPRANLRDARMEHANLYRSVFAGADMSGADLTGADLRHADLTGANLQGANLLAANLTGASLRDADLRDADLALTNLNGADVEGCDFSRATLAKTVFARCRNLAAARGLAGVSHVDTSSIDLETLIGAGPELPEAFLAGFGLEELEVARLRAALRR